MKQSRLARKSCVLSVVTILGFLERIGFSSDVKEHCFSRALVFLVFVWVDSMGAVKYVNGGTGICVIRCSRDQYRVVWAAITFITEMRSMPLFLNLLHLSGKRSVFYSCCSLLWNEIQRRHPYSPMKHSDS